MRKYATTWIVFLFLLCVVVFVFSLTKTLKKDNQTPLSYTQLLQKIHDSPSEIAEIQIINNEPVIMVKLKGSQTEQQVIVPVEAKADLIKEINAAGITVKACPPDKSSFWWGFKLGPITWFSRDSQ